VNKPIEEENVRKVASLVSALIIALVALPQAVSAAQSSDHSSDQPATLVVYRADEASSTKRVKFQVRLDSQSVGKLKYDRVITTSVEPGQYTLDTSLADGEALVLDLKPGKTYYVHSRVSKLGHKIRPELVVVEEQVAVAQQPAINAVIEPGNTPS
jgi:hypothetical protein